MAREAQGFQHVSAHHLWPEGSSAPRETSGTAKSALSGQAFQDALLARGRVGLGRWVDLRGQVGPGRQAPTALKLPHLLASVPPASSW
ncbi:hypothetical protein MC885_000714 [Smutsia gigantea]|nr:hypothetical protein MC885_000714 [Smutsia gigantea]